MLPELEQSSADFQAALAQAVRQNNAALLPDAPPDRLAVYARLIRNNLHGFIDRCFTEAPRYCEDKTWADLKEDFLRHGRAHSPYFQDIAGEFLDFCRQCGRLPEFLLELMTFEHAQLLAEVALTDDEDHDAAAPNRVFKLSATAFLLDFQHNVLHESKAFQAAPCQILVWRNREDQVLYRALDAIDFMLLSLLSEQSYTLESLCRELSTALPETRQWQPLLEQAWQYWLENGALVSEPAQ